MCKLLINIKIARINEILRLFKIFILPIRIKFMSMEKVLWPRAQDLKSRKQVHVMKTPLHPTFIYILVVKLGFTGLFS